MQRNLYDEHKVGRSSRESDDNGSISCFRIGFDSQQEDEDRNQEDKCDVSAIVALRKKMGLTQAAFAEKFRIPAQTYAQWESFKRTPPEYVLALLKDACERELKDMEDLPFTYGEIYNGNACEELTYMECPVKLQGEEAKLISTLDELGTPIYYLTVGYINPSDVGLMKYWLSTLEDPDIKEMMDGKGFPAGFDIKEYWMERYSKDNIDKDGIDDATLRQMPMRRPKSYQIDPDALGL